jgi:outer membrane protease
MGHQIEAGSKRSGRADGDEDMATVTNFPTDMSIVAVEARALAGYAALTGERRRETVEYFEGLTFGRWGTTSQAGRDYARRVLDAMSDAA